MLQLKDIVVELGDRMILNQLSLTVQAGEWVVVTGHNGAGKSTLFNVISGQLKPKSGQIFLDQTEVTSLSEKQRAQWIGRLNQNVNQGVVGEMTVAENLALATFKNRTVSLKAGLKSFPKYLVNDVLLPLNLGLEHLLETPVGRLSGGQRQIIAFLMAVMVKPKVLLLDEPTAALDPESGLKLMEFTKNYAQQHQLAVLMITHDTQLAKQVGSRCLKLHAGVLSNS